MNRIVRRVLGAAVPLAIANALGLAGATAASASPTAGPCAQGFCVQQVSVTSPPLAIADGASHRVIGTANLGTAASHYIWKVGPVQGGSCDAPGWKTAEWDRAGDAGASGLYLTEVNHTQIYNHPSSDPIASREWCYDSDSGSWMNKATGLEIKTQGNGLALTLVNPASATAFVARPVG